MPLNRPIWLDAHLAPSLAAWLESRFMLEARSFERLGLLTASDEDAFAKAREANAIILTKDADFPQILARLGAPPALIWLTVGNTSSTRLRAILGDRLEIALDMIEQGERLVEIGG